MNIKQVLSRTLWLIMAIHFCVFIIIGFVSENWRLIQIFFPLLALMVIVKYICKSISSKKNN